MAELLQSIQRVVVCTYQIEQKTTTPGRDFIYWFIIYLYFQQQYSLLRRHSELEEFMVCENEGLGVLPWSPLKG